MDSRQPGSGIDLIDRTFAEPFRDASFYLDSGWPGDNHEVTFGIAMGSCRAARLGVRLVRPRIRR